MPNNNEQFQNNPKNSEIRRAAKEFADEFVNLRDEIGDHLDAHNASGTVEYDPDHIANLPKRNRQPELKRTLDGRMVNHAEKRETLSSTLRTLQQYAESDNPRVKSKLAHVLLGRIKQETQGMSDKERGAYTAEAFKMIFGVHGGDVLTREALLDAKNRGTFAGIGRQRNEAITDFALEELEEIKKAENKKTIDHKNKDLYKKETKKEKKDTNVQPIVHKTIIKNIYHSPEKKDGAKKEQKKQVVDQVKNHYKDLAFQQEQELRKVIQNKDIEGIKNIWKKIEDNDKEAKKLGYPQIFAFAKKYQDAYPKIIPGGKVKIDKNKGKVKGKEKMSSNDFAALIYDNLKARLDLADKKPVWDGKQPPFWQKDGHLYMSDLDGGHHLIMRSEKFPKGYDATQIVDLANSKRPLFALAYKKGDFEGARKMFEKQTMLLNIFGKKLVQNIDRFMDFKDIAFTDKAGKKQNVFGLSANGEKITVLKKDGKFENIIEVSELPEGVSVASAILHLEQHQDDIEKILVDNDNDKENDLIPKVSPEEATLFQKGMTEEESKEILSASGKGTTVMALKALSRGMESYALGKLSNTASNKALLTKLAIPKYKGVKFLRRIPIVGRFVGGIAGLTEAQRLNASNPDKVIETIKGVVEFIPFAGSALELTEGIQALFTGKRMGTDISMNTKEAWMKIASGVGFLVLDIFTLGLGRGVKGIIKIAGTKIWKAATWPVRKGWELLKKIPGVTNAVTGVKNWFKRTFTKEGVKSAARKTKDFLQRQKDNFNNWRRNRNNRNT